MQIRKKIRLIRDQIPVLYRYNPIARWLMILLSTLVVIYCVYFLLRFVNSETGMFYKLLPMFICFIALQSILGKVTSLNSVLFEKDYLRLGFIARRPIIIAYDDIRSLDLKRKITYYLVISYSDAKGKPAQYTTPASFPNILEVIVNIADLAHSAVIPETMKNLLEYVKESMQDEL